MKKLHTIYIKFVLALLIQSGFVFAQDMLGPKCWDNTHFKNSLSQVSGMSVNQMEQSIRATVDIKTSVETRTKGYFQNNYGVGVIVDMSLPEMNGFYLVATNRHVLHEHFTADLKKLRNPIEIHGLTKEGETFEYKSPKLIFFSEKNDIALLAIEKNKIDFELQTLKISNFANQVLPNAQHIMITSCRYKNDYPKARAFKSTFLYKNTPLSNGANYLSSFAIKQGQSGSPVIDDQGKVVGIGTMRVPFVDHAKKSTNYNYMTIESFENLKQEVLSRYAAMQGKTQQEMYNLVIDVNNTKNYDIHKYASSADKCAYVLAYNRDHEDKLRNSSSGLFQTALDCYVATFDLEAQGVIKEAGIQNIIRGTLKQLKNGKFSRDPFVEYYLLDLAANGPVQSDLSHDQILNRVDRLVADYPWFFEAEKLRCSLDASCN